MTEVKKNMQELVKLFSLISGQPVCNSRLFCLIKQFINSCVGDHFIRAYNNKKKNNNENKDKLSGCGSTPVTTILQTDRSDTS